MNDWLEVALSRTLAFDAPFGTAGNIRRSTQGSG
jgi:hypothetical protein